MEIRCAYATLSLTVAIWSLFSAVLTTSAVCLRIAILSPSNIVGMPLHFLDTFFIIPRSAQQTSELFHHHQRRVPFRILCSWQYQLPHFPKRSSEFYHWFMGDTWVGSGHIFPMFSQHKSAKRRARETKNDSGKGIKEETAICFHRKSGWIMVEPGLEDKT